MLLYTFSVFGAFTKGSIPGFGDLEDIILSSIVAYIILFLCKDYFTYRGIMVFYLCLWLDVALAIFWLANKNKLE